MLCKPVYTYTTSSWKKMTISRRQVEEDNTFKKSDNTFFEAETHIKRKRENYLRVNVFVTFIF